MQSFSLTPIAFRGDPVSRGLAKLPTLFTANDVAQGAAEDAPITLALASASQQMNAASQGVASGSASFDSGENAPTATAPFAGGSTIDVGAIVNAFTSDSGSSTGDSGNPDCANMSILHPIDAATCLLDRLLFGLGALVLLALGIYIFAKD